MSAGCAAVVVWVVGCADPGRGEGVIDGSHRSSTSSASPRKRARSGPAAFERRSSNGKVGSVGSRLNGADDQRPPSFGRWRPRLARRPSDSGSRGAGSGWLGLIGRLRGGSGGRRCGDRCRVGVWSGSAGAGGCAGVHEEIIATGAAGEGSGRREREDGGAGGHEVAHNWVLTGSFVSGGLFERNQLACPGKFFQAQRNSPWRTNKEYALSSPHPPQSDTSPQSQYSTG
jgi:hypothetical protein